MLRIPCLISSSLWQFCSTNLFLNDSKAFFVPSSFGSTPFSRLIPIMRGSSSNTGQSVMSSQLVRGRSMWSVKVTHFSDLNNIKDDIICVKTYLVKTPPSPIVETVSLWKHSMCTLATGGLDFNSSAIVLVTTHQRLQVELARACGVPAVVVRAVDCWQ